jgi:hypothetical protein
MMMSRLLLNGCSFTEGMDNLDRIEQEGIEVINIAKGSAGNTYISNTTRQYIDNNEVDCVFIQWSALIRGYQSQGNEGTVNLTIEEQMKLPDYDENLNDNPKYDLFKYTLDLIKDTQEFLEKRDIVYRMYFGWTQFYENELEEYEDLYHTMEDIKSKNTFWFYKHVSGLITDKQVIYNPYNLVPKGFKTNPYGGMAEYVYDKVGKEGLKEDGHPSDKGNQYFIENVLIKLLGH